MTSAPARRERLGGRTNQWRWDVIPDELAQGAKKKIRVLIADREGIFRFGLKELFAVEDDLRVVAQAHTRRSSSN